MVLSFLVLPVGGRGSRIRLTWLACAVAVLLGSGCGSSDAGGGSGVGATALPSTDIGFGIDGKVLAPDASASDLGAADTAPDDGAAPDAGPEVTCTPDCVSAGKTCGSDGCGGVCGFCKTDWACLGFTCKQLASPDACASAKCDANAYCTADAGGPAKCVCKPGWKGDGKMCVDDDECATGNGGCDANALCTNAIGQPPTCACTKGFNGNGSKCFDDDECKDKLATCAEHAVCKNTIGSYECPCDEGFAGDGTTLCKDVDECKNGAAKCGTAQACDNTAGSYVCSCPPGYTKFGTSCTDIDECATGTAGCSPNATCKDKAGSYTCTCKTGWQGDGKTCTEVDLCKTVTCGVGATCQKGASGLAICVCDAGLVGDGKSCTQAIVNVTLVGVILAAVDTKGDCWDSAFGECTKPSASELGAIKAALDALVAAFTGATSDIAVKTAALENALKTVGGLPPARPDAYGNAQLLPGGGEFKLVVQNDSFLPAWPAIQWSKVALLKGTSLKVTLLDEDLALDEELGSVIIDLDALAKGLALGQAIAVPVAGQSPSILAVKILVTAWVGCGDGKCAGGETAVSCSADCAATGPKCGDAKCDLGETTVSCPADCKAPVGSCVGFCGKKSTAGCWCDDLCEKNGDCCTDKAAVCAIGCKGMCGLKSHDASGTACWCDSLCAKGGDCCSDVKTFCP